MLNVLERRAPWLRVVISPARVQGDGAAAEIITAIRDMERVAASGLAPVDVIVVARGGGSMEDLWEFNHEELARVIASCSLPIVSAVGHEIDFTIADFVADLRAPTPSAAAELVAPDTAEVLRQLQQRASFFHRHVTTTLAASQRHLAGLARSALFREPQMRIEQLTQRVDSAELALLHTIKGELNRRRQVLADHASDLRLHRPDQKLALLRQRMEALTTRGRDSFARQLQLRKERLKRVAEMLRLLSPEHTLQRGYTLTTDAEGNLLRSVKDAPNGSTLVTKMRDGKITSIVHENGGIQSSGRKKK
jgi:exodeoxyribonuclease VII large subunit